MTASFRTIGPNKVDRAMPCASSKHRWKVSPSGPADKRRPTHMSEFAHHFLLVSLPLQPTSHLSRMVFSPQRSRTSRRLYPIAEQSSDSQRRIYEISTYHDGKPRNTYMSHNSLASDSATSPLVTTSGKGFRGVGSGLVFFRTRKWTLPSILTRFLFLFVFSPSSSCSPSTSGPSLA